MQSRSTMSLGENYKICARMRLLEDAIAVPDALEVWLHDTTLATESLVGELARERKRGHEAVRFTYSVNWLEPSQHKAFDLAPDLQRTPGPHFPAADHDLPGVFSDATPDRWGRTLLDRREIAEARREARAPRRLSEWDYLAGVNDATRLGALRLRDADRDAFVDDRDPAVPPATRLRELEAAALALDSPDAESRQDYAESLRLLLQPGTSLGGARPKASFLDTDGSLWLAKFPAHDDRVDVGAWEMLAHRLADAAGIVVPSAQLMSFGGRYRTFCVQRFDRAAGTRRHYASGMTLLRRKPGDQSSYLELAQALQDNGDPLGIPDDLAELFRRVVFNVLIGNRDDHLRNHGVLRGARGWRLAPAFDVNPNPDKMEHALALDEADPRPVVAHVAATHDFYRLSAADAARIEGEVREVVSGWRAVATTLDIAPAEQALIARIIDPARS